MKWALVIMTVLLGIDQASKFWVMENVSRGQIIVLLPNYLELTFVQNKGVSFSFLSELPDIIRLPLLLGIAGLAVVGMSWFLFRHWKEHDRYFRMALIWIIPGALGNLIDRAIFHAVTDFLHFRFYQQSFFVNNLADCFISMGVAFFLISMLTQRSQQTENSAEEGNNAPKSI